MTRILTANIGSYPRIGEEKDQQRLRRALHHLQYKEISAHAFHDVEQSVIQEIVREQILAGVDEATDGGVSWHDPVSHFCRKVAGIRLSGLNRYFETNTYYRIPVFTGKPRRKAPHNLSDYVFAQSVSNRPIRIVMTGPYTMARLSGSEIRTFQSVESRFRFFAESAAQEIHSLVSQGATVIQLDEPAVPRYPAEIRLIAKALEDLRAKAKPAALILNFFWTPLAPVYDRLAALPVSGFNFDFTADGDALYAAVLASPPATLGFGVLDGLSTQMEMVSPWAERIRQFRDKYDGVACYVTPSCGLEYLRRDDAFQKLRLAAKIRDEADSRIPIEDHAGETESV